jgi:hypothetical protein
MISNKIERCFDIEKKVRKELIVLPWQSLAVPVTPTDTVPSPVSALAAVSAHVLAADESSPVNSTTSCLTYGPLSRDTGIVFKPA